jgi:hypothetical protein
MDRIILPTGPVISRNILALTKMLIDVRDLAERTKDIADERTDGGVNKAALENAPEVVVSTPLVAGQGAMIYDALTTIINAVGPSAVAIKAIIKKFDQG